MDVLTDALCVCLSLLLTQKFKKKKKSNALDVFLQVRETVTKICFKIFTKADIDTRILQLYFSIKILPSSPKASLSLVS